jgi:hypothetical protein
MVKKKRKTRREVLKGGERDLLEAKHAPVIVL